MLAGLCASYMQAGVAIAGAFAASIIGLAGIAIATGQASRWPASGPTFAAASAAPNAAGTTLTQRCCLRALGGC